MKDANYIFAYSQGFRDGAKLDPRNPTELYIMGYKFDKIIELISKDMDKEGVSMKKQFTSIKLLNWMEEYGEVNIYEKEEGLEVWIGGMLKYREPKPKPKSKRDEIISKLFGVDYIYVEAKLRELGYEIIKRDPD